MAQVALHSAVAEAPLNRLAAAAGTDRLAQLIRADQDLAVEAERLDKQILEAVSREPSSRDAAREQKIRDRIAAVAHERSDLQRVFRTEFPELATFSKPEPLSTQEIQSLLADDEAVVVVILDHLKSHIWAVTRDRADWRELAVTSAQVSKTVRALRSQLDIDSHEPFDTALSFQLYRELLGPVEEMIASKLRLSIVVNGALTGLPPQVLVTRDPTGKALKDVDWLVRQHAVTILPSLASLKVLRGRSATSSAPKPLIGFADPVFDRIAPRQERRVADLTLTKAVRGGVANILNLETALPPLPGTAEEVQRVAARWSSASPQSRATDLAQFFYRGSRPLLVSFTSSSRLLESYCGE